MRVRPDECVNRLVVCRVSAAAVPITQERPNIAVDLEVAPAGGAPFRANILRVVLTRLVRARNEDQERAWSAIYTLITSEEMAGL